MVICPAMRCLRIFPDAFRPPPGGQVDWAGRHGGEAFLIVLPETGQTCAMILAERLRAAVSVSVTRAGGCDVSVTASFGVTGFSPPDGQKTVTPELLLRQADLLLYEAKAAGHNQVRGRLSTR